ncbi:calcium-binding protein [Pseudovibrio sp. Ad26]|uniref:calcium-binding protein n=1 Tax=Pseudovibrio sp. Ad26 TaxID=989410 RepID=UPI0007AE5C52|nr:calcium-binding protein [Pseudovibrio sp. Ad26]KZL05259.1 Bifunctional hemolysin/adenylate cyclase precursor [Pseudovibrio sp. Ad26]
MFFVGPLTGGNRDFLIKDFSANDTLFFSGQLNFASLKPVRDGDDLIITSSFATDLTRTVVLEDYFVSTANRGKIQAGEVELTEEIINLSINTGRLQAKSDQDSGIKTGADPDTDTIFTSLLNRAVTIEFSNVSGFEGVIGSDGSDVIKGDDKANIIYGGGGSDSIYGNGGDDIIHPGQMYRPNGPIFGYFDTLDGGEGFDIVSFEGENDAQIKIDLGQVGSEGYSEVRSVRASSSYKYDYYYRSSIEFKNFEGVIGGNHDDVIIGDSIANYLSGGSGNDSLSGKGGADTLVGGAGNDILTGGLGNDVLVGGTGADTFIIGGAGEAGTQDTIYDFDASEDILGLYGDTATVEMQSSQFVLDPVTKTQKFYEHSALVSNSETSVLLYGVTATEALQLLSNKGSVELSLGDAGGTVIGNERANSIAGGDGDDLIFGMGGNDTIKVSSGTDTLDGGAGFDILDLSESNGPIRYIFGANEQVRFLFLREGQWVSDVITRNFEGLIGSQFADNVNGSNGANIIDGKDGNDELWAYGGNDTVNGGAGDDRIWGMIGDDLLTGGTGADRFLYSGFAGGMDTITDFDITEDRFEMISDAADSFADITMTDTQDGVRLEWDGHMHDITEGALLQGVNSSQISEDHFIFG